MSKPTYTKEEVLNIVSESDLRELEDLRLILKSEVKLYPISALKLMKSAMDKRVKYLARRDAIWLKRFLRKKGLDL